jgi:hypothetical protein
LREAIQNFHGLKDVNRIVFMREVLEVNWNHIEHISYASFQNNVAVLRIEALLVINFLELRLNSLNAKPKKVELAIVLIQF